MLLKVTIYSIFYIIFHKQIKFKQCVVFNLYTEQSESSSNSENDRYSDKSFTLEKYSDDHYSDDISITPNKKFKSLESVSKVCIYNQIFVLSYFII